MRRVPGWSRPLMAATLLFCFSACGGKTGFGTPSTLPAAVYQGGSPVRELGHARRKIQHVVIIIQENRSFNNLFYGYPGAKTAKYGHDSKKQKIELKPIPLETNWDLEHNPHGFIAACNGKGKIPGTECRMNGFDNETWTCDTPKYPKCPIEYPPYAFVPHDETKPYFEMAHQYVLADEMFASNFDSTSFMSHQYIIAGVNPDASIGIPDGRWGCPGGTADRISVLGSERVWPVGSVRPCWDVTTLGDELHKAGLSWSFYATPLGDDNHKTCGHPGADAGGGGTSNGRGIWSAYQTIAHICYGPDLERPCHVAALEIPQRHRKRKASATSRGSRRRMQTPITEDRVQKPVQRGLHRSSTQSASRNTGNRLQSSSFGMTTAAGTIPSRRST